MDVVKDLNFSVFQEPRGVMRILHFVFSICAFATVTGFSGFIRFACNKDAKIEYEYPFYIVENLTLTQPTECSISVSNDFSSDARFFVATGVLAFLYSIAIIYVYVKMDEAYKINKRLPLYDFLITIFLAVLWLSSSAAWANALTGLKSITSKPVFEPPGCCSVTNSSYSTLNISVVLTKAWCWVSYWIWLKKQKCLPEIYHATKEADSKMKTHLRIFGFLNFFLWAADLWFLYKETEWFQGGAPPTTSGV